MPEIIFKRFLIYFGYEILVAQIIKGCYLYKFSYWEYDGFHKLNTKYFDTEKDILQYIDKRVEKELKQ